MLVTGQLTEKDLHMKIDVMIEKDHHTMIEDEKEWERFCKYSCKLTVPRRLAVLFVED